MGEGEMKCIKHKWEGDGWCPKCEADHVLEGEE